MQKKLAVIFSLTIIIVSTAVSFISVRLYSARVMDDMKHRLAQAKESVNQYFQGKGREALGMSVVLAKENAFVRRVILGSYTKEEAEKEMEEWKRTFGADYFEISGEDERSIVQSDDYLTSERDVSYYPKTPVAGIEVLQDKILLSGVAPVFEEEKSASFLAGLSEEEIARVQRPPRFLGIVKSSFILDEGDLAEMKRSTGLDVHVTFPESTAPLTTFPKGVVDTEKFQILAFPLESNSGARLTTKVTLGLPVSFFDDANKRIQRAIGFTTIVMVIFGIGFLIILNRFLIIKPLRAVVEGARRIGEGRLEHRIGVQNKDEIGEVARSFNKMAEDLGAREREIAAERDKTKLIVNELDDAIVVYDKEYRIFLMNPKAERLLGVKEKTIRGQSIIEHAGEGDERFALLYRIIASPIKGSRKEEIRLGEIGERVLEVTTIQLPKTADEPARFIKVLHDVTREREIERLKSEFVSIASHQLRTPLSGIKWMVKMVLDGDVGKLNDEQNDFLHKVYQSNERMIQLVNDLLNVSRIEEGRTTFSFAKFNVVALLREIIDQDAPACANKKLTLETNVKEAGEIIVNGDREKLSLALTNLLDNAIKYTPAKGSIRITAQIADGGAGIVISDTGIGIGSEDQKKLFKKFFRAESAPKVEGTGLGLFIVKNIIEKHKGRIAVESEIGKGATFRVWLPG